MLTHEHVFVFACIRFFFNQKHVFVFGFYTCVLPGSVFQVSTKVSVLKLKSPFSGAFSSYSCKREA